MWPSIKKTRVESSADRAYPNLKQLGENLTMELLSLLKSSPFLQKEENLTAEVAD